MLHCLDNDVTLEVARLFVEDLSFDKQILSFNWSREVESWHAALRAAVQYLVHKQVIVYENISFGK